jgi:hypothetical protein
MPESTTGHVPISWPELIAAMRRIYHQDARWAEEIAREIATLRPPIYAATGFAGPAVVVAARAIIDGPAACTPLLERLVPLVPRALTDFPGSVGDLELPAIFLLSFLNAARCCGYAPAEARDLEPRWLRELAARVSELAEHERHTLALAALAARLPRLVPTFAPDRTTDTGFTPHRTFGFSVPGFAHYLAAALERGASYLDVEPAWLDFVHRFPYKLGAGTLDWPDLLWAARAVLTHFEGVPEGEVAARLHRLVTAGGGA